jgi:hypothetical protein
MSATGHPISLAHLTVLDATPPELVTVAAAAGFRTVGIRLTATPSVGVPPYDVLHEGPMLRETMRRLKDTGVSVLDTEFLRFEPEHPIGIPEGFLEVSARLGARNVLVMSAEPEEARTIERFGELCDRAAQYGLHVGLEFAIYTGVRTLAHVGRGRCLALQPVRRNPHSHRPGRSIAVPLRADLRCRRGDARTGRYAQPHSRGADGPSAPRRRSAAPPRAGGGAARRRAPGHRGALSGDGRSSRGRAREARVSGALGPAG